MSDRPTAESPKTLNKAARALLDDWRRGDMPVRPGLDPSETFRDRLLEVQAEAAALNKPSLSDSARPEHRHKYVRNGAYYDPALPYSSEDCLTCGQRDPKLPLPQPTPDDKPSLDAVTAWLQSPETESRLAVAIEGHAKAHSAPAYSHECQDFCASEILAALTKP